MWDWLADTQHWIAYWTGSANYPGIVHNYNFFSGFGSDLSEITLVFAIFSLIAHSYRVHNCEVTGCWRIGRHDTAANHTVCRKHHPDDKLTAKDVMEAHYNAKRNS